MTISYNSIRDLYIVSDSSDPAAVALFATRDEAADFVEENGVE